MRAENELTDNVNVHLRATRAAARVSTNGHFQGILHEASSTHAGEFYEDKEHQVSVLERWFLPRRETRLMAEEALKTGGLWMPYPLLGILLTLVLVLGGGIIGLYSTVTTMNATMTMRDADRREEVHKLEVKTDLLQMYINADREALAVLKDRADKPKRSN